MVDTTFNFNIFTIGSSEEELREHVDRLIGKLRVKLDWFEFSRKTSLPGFQQFLKHLYALDEDREEIFHYANLSKSLKMRTSTGELFVTFCKTNTGRWFCAVEYLDGGYDIGWSLKPPRIAKPITTFLEKQRRTRFW